MGAPHPSEGPPTWGDLWRRLSMPYGMRGPLETGGPPLVSSEKESVKKGGPLSRLRCLRGPPLLMIRG